ncbi:MAG: flippase-like domain-containing protein [Bacteroidia bacterium]|nr:flippase-like domain-containing protein [Bacteroidia bacterium]
MKKKVIDVIKYIAFSSLAIVLLYLAFKGIEFHKLLESLKKANYWWVLFSLFFAFIAYYSRAYRWALLIEPLGYKPSVKNSFYSLMVGYFANLAFPRIGEVTRCASLSKAEKIPFDKLIGTVILERVCDVFVLLSLLIIVFVAKINFFGKFLKENVFYPFIQKLSSVFHFSNLIIFVGIAIIIVLGLLLFLFRNRIKKINMVIKAYDFIKGIITGVKTIFHMKKFGAFILHTIIIWGSYFLMTYIVFFALDTTSNLSMIDGLFILIIGGLGMSAPVQGGLGAFHWIVSLGLTLYGISREDGLVYATLSHTAQALFAIFLGTLSLVMLFLSRKKQL